MFLFTYSSSEIPLGSRVILYTVGKVFVRRLQRRRNRRKRFSSGGEIPGTSLANVNRGTDHSFGNQCRESKKAGSILGSLLFPSYLFFHTSDSGQIWDPQKAVFKENLTLLRARRLEKNSWRTLEVTGTNQLT